MSKIPTFSYFILPPGLTCAALQARFTAFADLVGVDTAFTLTNYAYDHEPTRLPAVVHDWRTFIAQRFAHLREALAPVLTFAFWLDNDEELTVNVILNPAERYMVLMANHNFFPMHNNVSDFLHLCQVLYDQVHPIYGYGILETFVQPAISSADAQQIDTLYNHNFLGPALVQAYGRQRLRTINAEAISDLADGGMLLVMEANPYQRLTDDITAYATAIKLLQIPRFVQVG